MILYIDTYADNVVNHRVNIVYSPGYFYNQVNLMSATKFDQSELYDLFEKALNEDNTELEDELLANLSRKDFEILHNINESCDYDEKRALPIYSTLLFASDFIEFVHNYASEEDKKEFSKIMPKVEWFMKHMNTICGDDKHKRIVLLVAFVHMCIAFRALEFGDE